MDKNKICYLSSRSTLYILSFFSPLLKRSCNQLSLLCIYIRTLDCHLLCCVRTLNSIIRLVFAPFCTTACQSLLFAPHPTHSRFPAYTPKLSHSLYLYACCVCLPEGQVSVSRKYSVFSSLTKTVFYQ